MLYYLEYRQIVGVKEQLKRLKTLDEDKKTMFLEKLDEMMLHIKDGKLYSEENIAILQEIKDEINKKWFSFHFHMKIVLMFIIIDKMPIYV